MASTSVLSYSASPFSSALDLDVSVISDTNEPSLEERLEAWCKEKEGDDEHEKRLVAAARIKKAAENSAQILDLSYLGLSSLPECLGELKKLRNLQLKGNRISNLEPLKGLVGLKGLFLGGNEIVDIAPLKHLSELITLDLTRNFIVDISPLRHLPQLRRLLLSSNELNDLGPLGLIENLEVLHLDNCKLSDLTPLASLKYLNHLSLSENPIQNIEPIGLMVQLEHLNLDRTDIEELPLSLARMRKGSTIDTKNTHLTHASIRQFQKAIREASAEDPDLGPEFILPVETDTPPYDMVAALGFQKRPIILRGAHPTAPVMGPKITNLLNKLGANAFDFDLNFDVPPDVLNNEVHKGIQAARARADSPLSISERLMQIAQENPDQYPAIQRIQECAEKALSECQGLALPGGLNVEQEFYDAAAPLEPKDYERTVAEICLIDAAQRQKKPIIGTCRGAQLINVKCGGTLKSAGHLGWGTVELYPSSKKAALEAMFGSDPVSAYSHHYQSCDRIADNMEVVMGHDGVPKLMISKDDRIIGVQVHPECDENDLYSKSIELYRLFFTKVKESLPVDLSHGPV